MPVNVDEELEQLRLVACSLDPLEPDLPDHSEAAGHSLLITDIPTNSCHSPLETYPHCSSASSLGGSTSYYRRIEHVLNTKVCIFICAFGLVGNICNLAVFIPQGRRCAMGRIERSVYWGLVALAVSDLSFCLVVVLNVFVEREEVSESATFSLVYSVYNNAFVNVFLLASTWLTIVMAIGRYLAICHPFRAREIIGTTVAKRIVLIVYVFCVLMNAPRFLFYKVVRINCEVGSRSFYFRWPSYVHIRTHPQLESAYSWFFFTFGILVPCVLLVFCNAFLVRALRRARTKLRLIRAVEVSSVDQYRAVTLILVALVLMHVVLVSPVDFVFFLRQQLIAEGNFNEVYDLISAVGNTLQAINFSVNFLLYCVINVHFRRAFVRLVSFRWLRFRRPANVFGGHLSSKMAAAGATGSDSVTMTTTCVTTTVAMARAAAAHNTQM